MYLGLSSCWPQSDLGAQYAPKGEDLVERLCYTSYHTVGHLSTEIGSVVFTGASFGGCRPLVSPVLVLYFMARLRPAHLTTEAQELVALSHDRTWT